MSLNLVEGAWTMYIHNCSHHRPSDYHRTVLLMTVKEAVFVKLKHEVFLNIMCIYVHGVLRKDL